MYALGVSLPGKSGKPLIEEGYAPDASRLFSDGKALYAGGADFSCAKDVHVYPLEGKSRTISAGGMSSPRLRTRDSSHVPS